ncbi:MAG: hypothetical protein JWN54_1181 [Mycobacterium sp.]|nr:hypothetical protein [Mycobacterium sp.]
MATPYRLRFTSEAQAVLTDLAASNQYASSSSRKTHTSSETRH